MEISIVLSLFCAMTVVTADQYYFRWREEVMKRVDLVAQGNIDNSIFREKAELAGARYYIRGYIINRMDGNLGGVLEGYEKDLTLMMKWLQTPAEGLSITYVRLSKEKVIRNFTFQYFGVYTFDPRINRTLETVIDVKNQLHLVANYTLIKHYPDLYQSLRFYTIPSRMKYAVTLKIPKNKPKYERPDEDLFIGKVNLMAQKMMAGKPMEDIRISKQFRPKKKYTRRTTTKYSMEDSEADVVTSDEMSLTSTTERTVEDIMARTTEITVEDIMAYTTERTVEDIMAFTTERTVKDIMASSTARDVATNADWAFVGTIVTNLTGARETPEENVTTEISPYEGAFAVTPLIKMKSTKTRPPASPSKKVKIKLTKEERKAKKKEEEIIKREKKLEEAKNKTTTEKYMDRKRKWPAALEAT